MANKFFALFLLLFVFIACNQQGKSDEALAAQAKKDSLANCSINPNGQSELAIMMRQMQGHLNSIKESAIAGTISGQIPEFLNEIHTANPTDSSMVDGEFGARSDEYIAVVKELYSSKSENQKIAYNAVVAKCQSCHEHYCPGPLVVIKKMYITL